MDNLLHRYKVFHHFLLLHTYMAKWKKFGKKLHIDHLSDNYNPLFYMTRHILFNHQKIYTDNHHNRSNTSHLSKIPFTDQEMQRHTFNTVLKYRHCTDDQTDTYLCSSNHTLHYSGQTRHILYSHTILHIVVAFLQFYMPSTCNLRQTNNIP